jgi:trehalose 6-phosphate synthase
MGLPQRRPKEVRNAWSGEIAGSPAPVTGIRKLPGWTRQTLSQMLGEQLRDHKLIIVSNREPYMHVRSQGGIKIVETVGGVVSALDPIMRAVGGTWVAQASGEADRDTADSEGRLQVPEGPDRYTLKRVFLTPQEEAGYYYGFANEGLWPLCHIAFQPPVFDEKDWESYVSVNELFAQAVLREAQGSRPLIFIHDYHFALLARMVKQRLPQAIVFQFWHIPWPSSEVFRICPWKSRILEGLLGNDLIAFHIQNHCNNFLDSVDRQMESRIDWEEFSVTREGHTTSVKSAPIGVDYEELSLLASSPEVQEEALKFRIRHQLDGRKIILSIDRMDYTKGILQRFQAVDRLFQLYPEHLGKIVHVQLGVPSRSRIPAYSTLQEEIERQVQIINARHGTEHWQPILYLKEQRDRKDLLPLYRAAQVCAVTSVHDGMNLVAKEYIASRTDGLGSLVLSEFVGAARELSHALLVNPYAIGPMAEALHQALLMPEHEQKGRMSLMRETVREQNVYRWVGRLLIQAAQLDSARPWW